jgi:hypothetical protein
MSNQPSGDLATHSPNQRSESMPSLFSLILIPIEVITGSIALQPTSTSGTYANVPAMSPRVYSGLGDLPAISHDYQQVNIIDVNSLVPSPAISSQQQQY